MRIIRASDYSDMCRKAANFIGSQITLKPNSVLGLATGSTPIGIYNYLSDWYQSGEIDFSAATSINLDEYLGLGADHPQSYRYYMEHNLFRRINIRPENTHVPNGLECDKTAECMRYETVIKKCGGIDMQLLGIGHNGHIGFNEPGEYFEKITHCVRLADSTIKANKRFFESESEVPHFAYTMGIGTIMKAGYIIVAVSGQDKAQIVKEAFSGHITPLIPASILQLHSNAVLIASEDALSLLDVHSLAL